MDQTKDDASLIIASGAQQMALAEHSSGSTGTGRSPAGSGLYSSLAVLPARPLVVRRGAPLCLRCEFQGSQRLVEHGSLATWLQHVHALAQELMP